MNKSEQGMSTGTGGISILAIFVVLCLTTLATLSLVSARADYKLAEKTSLSAQEYYAADSAAEEQLAAVMAAAKGAYWQTAVEALGAGVQIKEGFALVSYSVTINDIKSLDVTIKLTLDGADVPTGEWSRNSWNTRVVSPAGTAQGLNVFTTLG